MPRAKLAILALCLAAAAVRCAPAVAAPAPILYVGDSLGVGTSPLLRSALRGQAVEVDTRVGRGSSEGLAVLRSRLRPRHRIVIFDVGTNDFDVRLFGRNLRRARWAIQDRQMIVLTMNRSGIEPFNYTVLRFAASTFDVIVADWYSLAQRWDLLAGDGIHASGSGYRLRAALIAGCIAAGRSLRLSGREPGRVAAGRSRRPSGCWASARGADRSRRL